MNIYTETGFLASGDAQKKYFQARKRLASPSKRIINLITKTRRLSSERIGRRPKRINTTCAAVDATGPNLATIVGTSCIRVNSTNAAIAKIATTTKTSAPTD